MNDASGNLLAVYDNKGTAMGQKEVPIYAASRLGVYNRAGNSYQYELTDHLGNVRVVINGTKQSNGQADVVYYSDYYPYGSPLTLAANDYRYGYQGQFAEVDKETGWNNFELRMYDPAIGRWMTTDPYGQYDSPYVGIGNNPISSVDPDGGYSKFWATIRQAWAWTTGQNPGALYQAGTSSDSWGYNTSNGDGFAFHSGFSKGLSSGQMSDMGLRNYGGDYSNSASDWFYYIGNEWINAYNPAANLWDVGTGVATGKDRFGNNQSPTETNLKLFGVLPIGIVGNVTADATESTLQHIFRNAAGHVNPTTIESRGRYLSIFESVASNPENLVPTVNAAANKAGILTYYKTFRNGKQVWVQTLNGVVRNAGVNSVAK